jgi:ankyrin repeat protein
MRPSHAMKIVMFFRLIFVACLVAAASAQTIDADRDALFAAIRRGATGDVERLIAKGVSPNARDAQGTPALMAAALFADADIVELLLKRGADPNVADESGATALMWSVPDRAKIQSLLERGAAVDARSDTGRTALLVAASYPGTVDVLRLLLARGADLRAQDRAGTTALALAVRSADVDVVRLLIERGLNPDALNPGARRAALARNYRPTIDYLISKGLGPIQDELYTTASWEPPELLARAIDAGAAVNASNAAQYGRTPLLTAVASEAAGADTLKLLLDRGADPNTATAEGETPLDWAIYKGDPVKIQLLEQRGAMRGTGPRREAIAPPATGGIADPRVSLRRSLARLLDVAPAFPEHTSCISCHHNALPAIAASTARRKGIEIDEARARANLDHIVEFFTASMPRMMLGDPAVGGEALTAGYVQVALARENHPLDTMTAAITHWLIARQMPDGTWLGNGLNRPPSEYSSISHTAMAAAGLTSYDIPALKSQIEQSLRRAQQWLLGAEPRSAEERGMRLMGLVWTKAPRPRVEAAIRDVRTRQEADGGWSQFGRTAPDAYATGLSLFALCVAGVPPTDDSYQRGVAFLLGTQYPDGTWLVKTHSFPVQRYFESGFPFGRHQWISTAGTSWASLAIAQTLTGGTTCGDTNRENAGRR